MNSSFILGESPQGIPEARKTEEDARKAQAMAFTIDFGGGKSVDRQKIEDLMRKSQARHQRVQSLSRIEAGTQRVPQKPPMSANLPRKNIGYNSEGYFSSDQEDSLLSISGGRSKMQSPCSDLKQQLKRPPMMSESYHLGVTKHVSKSPIVDSIMSRSDILPSRLGLNLPLRNTNSNLMSYSYTEQSHDVISEMSPDGLMLTDVSSPELDMLTPDDVATTPNHIDKDDGRSSTVSEAGTYTIEADTYTDEQKAKMRIDPVPEEQRNILEISCCYESPTETHEIKNAKSTRNYLEKIKNRVRSISEKTFQKKPVEVHDDVGSFTSVTTSGVFSSSNDPPKHQFKRKNSLTKSQIDASEYVHRIQQNESPKYNSTVLRNAVEKTKPPEETLVGKLSNISLSRCHGDRSWIQEWAESATKYKDDTKPSNDVVGNSTIMITDALPPASPRNSAILRGRHSPIASPTKIPSPVSTLSRNMNHHTNAISSNGQDTESFLLRTQDAITNLQARLQSAGSSSANPQAPPSPQDIRDRVLSRLPISQLSRSNSLSYRVRRGRESPISSPLRSPLGVVPTTPRTSLSPASSPIKTLSQSRRSSLDRPAVATLTSPQRIVGTVPSERLVPSPLRRSGSFGAAEYAGDDDDDDSVSGFYSDFDRGAARRTIASGARYNRAFELRRARIESPELKERHPVPSNTPRCPNTPETRRKFSASTPMNVKENGLKLETHKAPSTQRASHVNSDSRQRLYTNGNKTNSSARDLNAKGHDRAKKSKQPVNVKDVEFTNWKKRSSYDPMKSAMEAKKRTQNRKQHWEQHNDNTSPSHSSPVLRSQSFHAASALVEQNDTSDETEDEHLLILVEPGGRTAMERAMHLRHPDSISRNADVIINRDYLADFRVNSKSTDRLGLRRDNYRELRREDDPIDPPIDKRRTFVLDSDTNSTTNESSPRTSSVYSDSKMEDSSDFGVPVSGNETKSSTVVLRPKSSQRTPTNKQNRHSGDFSTISSSTTSTNRDHSATSRRNIQPKGTDIQPRYLDISKYKNEASAKNFLRRDPSKTYVTVLPHTHHARDETRKGSAMCIEQEMKSKELEKWKRRASYDPRKSAAQSRSKTVPASSTVLRSQSFHGPVVAGAMTSSSWRPNQSNDCGSSDNDF